MSSRLAVVASDPCHVSLLHWPMYENLSNSNQSLFRSLFFCVKETVLLKSTYSFVASGSAEDVAKFSTELTTNMYFAEDTCVVGF